MGIIRLIIMVFCLFVSITISAGFPTLSVHLSDYVQYVDPNIGSGGHGHVFVGTSLPYGMGQLGSSNIFKGWDWCSGYHYSDNIQIGFVHTHLGGTGCNNLGDVLLMPMNEAHTERGEQKNISNGYAFSYSHKNEVVCSDYYSVLLDKYQIRAELTATASVRDFTAGNGWQYTFFAPQAPATACW